MSLQMCVCMKVDEMMVKAMVLSNPLKAESLDFPH